MRSTRMILLRTIASELIEHSHKDADWFADLTEIMQDMGYDLVIRISIRSEEDIDGNR